MQDNIEMWSEFIATIRIRLGASEVVKYSINIKLNLRTWESKILPILLPCNGSNQGSLAAEFSEWYWDSPQAF